MKYLSFPALVLVILTGCRKNESCHSPAPVHPEMKYTLLFDTAILSGRSASFDLDGTGGKDIYFTTLLVGDPVRQEDKRQWLAGTSFDASLPVNSLESIPVLHRHDSITIRDRGGYNWYNASSVLLAQQVLSNTAPPVWQGDWMQAQHRYIPVQLIRPEGLYNGWVEVSFSMTGEKLVLHRMAICREPDRDIAAGH